jgi:formylglycine-generating enzyme required for sulfatase activity
MVLLTGVASVASGFGYEDLSETARKIVPRDELVKLHLDNGSIQEGLIVRENDEEVVLKQKNGSISFEFTYPIARIVRRDQANICDVFARSLLQHPFKPDGKLSKVYIESMTEIHEEFLKACPEHGSVEKIRKQAEIYSNASKQEGRGQVQIDGQWMNPVEAALYQIDKSTTRMELLLQKYPGVDRPNFAGDSRLSRAFQQLKSQRMSIAKKLPDYLQGRQPDLLKERRYEDAFLELDALHRFYLARPASKRLKKTVSKLKDPEFDKEIEGLDYRRIPEFIKQALISYQFGRADLKAETVEGDSSIARIPGGYFLMGDPLADPDQADNTARLVEVDDFLIDRYEVTNAEYREFLDHVKLTGDTSMEHPAAPPLKDHTPKGWDYPGLATDDLPVLGVDWFDAYAYAAWKGKRLPTEAEWEYLASSFGRDDEKLNGGGGKSFINAPSGIKLLQEVLKTLHRETYPPPDPNAKTNKWKKKQPLSVPPVRKLKQKPWPVDAEWPISSDAFADRAIPNSQYPEGIFHLFGNVPEWVQDRYDPAFPLVRDAQSPAGPEAGKGFVWRGGGFDIDLPAVYTRSFRGAESKLGKLLKRKEPLLIGFRCALDSAAEIPSKAE